MAYLLNTPENWDLLFGSLEKNIACLQSHFKLPCLSQLKHLTWFSLKLLEINPLIKVSSEVWDQILAVLLFHLSVGVDLGFKDVITLLLDELPF